MEELENKLRGLQRELTQRYLAGKGTSELESEIQVIALQIQAIKKEKQNV